LTTQPLQTETEQETKTEHEKEGRWESGYFHRRMCHLHLYDFSTL